MKARRLAAALILAAAGTAPAQVPGAPVPQFELTGLTGGPPGGLEALQGRALLLEFFAYW